MKNLVFMLSLLTNVWLNAQTKGVSPVISGNPKLVAGATHAVVIGISDYQDPAIPDLRYADKDAEAFANYLRSPAGGSVDGEHLTVLLNKDATAGRVAGALDALLEKSKEGDQVFLYFSGHGDVERKTVSQLGFLLCWDAPSRVYMGGGTYSLAYLQEIVTTLSTQNKAKVIVVTDACHAGKLAGSQIGGAELTAANLAKQFANEVKILSCQPGELSLEGGQWGGGRGVFSYHLVEGLYGLADKNADGYVTLGELDRYLEDNVTPEAAPQNQVPMLLGNKTERMAEVNANILADLKKSKSTGLASFAAIASRGFEDEVLTRVDSALVEIYNLFNKSLQEKMFFEPENACAETWYKMLITEPKLERLHSTIRRNYAAALQDEAQQAINIWLKADVQQLECIGKSSNYDIIPLQLAKAAELLGEKHYMYKSLIARKLLFEGINQKSWVQNEPLGHKLLGIFRQSAELEPNSPIPWHWMSLTYAVNLHLADSAFACAEVAHKLSPGWVLPYVDLATFYTTSLRQFDLAEKALKAAMSIDSLHPYTYNRKAFLLIEKGNYKEGADMLAKYAASGGTLYPCWHTNYAALLLNMNKYTEAEAEYHKAIQLDSTKALIWMNYSNLLIRTRRLAEAELVCKKALMLDSTIVSVLVNFATVNKETKNYAVAEYYYKKAIALDTTQFRSWNNLGSMYIDLGRYSEGEEAIRKANVINKDYVPAWINLGRIYTETRRFEKAEEYFKKAISVNPDFAFTYLNYAALKANMGDASGTIVMIEQAIVKGLTIYEYYTNQVFDPYRELPEWKALMKKYFPEK